MRRATTTRWTRNFLLSAGLTLSSASFSATLVQNAAVVNALSEVMGVDDTAIQSSDSLNYEVEQFLAEKSRSHPLKESLRKFWKKLKNGADSDEVSNGFAKRFDSYKNRKFDQPSKSLAEEISATAKQYHFVADSFMAFEQKILEGEFELPMIKKVFDIADKTSLRVGQNILGEEAMNLCVSEYEKTSIVNLFRLIVSTEGATDASLSTSENAKKAIAAMEKKATLVFEITPEQAHEKVCNQLNVDMEATACPRHFNFAAEACK